MLTFQDTRADSLPICDGVLAADMDSSLIWLPEYGYGFLQVREQPYDADYFAKYEGYAATEMGGAITAARADLAQRHAARHSLIDVGIGCGAFVTEMRARGWPAFGYDINPAGIDWLRSRDWYANPYLAGASVLTFWDSLEHIPDVAHLLQRTTIVLCSLPIVPGDGPPAREWKHYRPDEHCWYFTHSGFLRWMQQRGFVCLEHSTIEAELGREDIGTYAFRRRT